MIETIKRGAIVEYRQRLDGGEGLGTRVAWGRFSHWGLREGKRCAYVHPRHGKRYERDVVTPVEEADVLAVRKPPRRRSRQERV